MIPHFSLKVGKTTPGRSSPLEPRPHTGVRCTDILGSRRWPRSPLKAGFLSSVQRWPVLVLLCECFGNGSDVNPDLNRNKKPVADIP